MASRSGALDLVQPDEWMRNKRPHNQSEIFPSILTLPTGTLPFVFIIGPFAAGAFKIAVEASVDFVMKEPR
eukprot:754897-Prymnesium_polylepis.1